MKAAILKGLLAGVAGLGAAAAVALVLGLAGVNPVVAAFPATGAYCWVLCRVAK